MKMADKNNPDLPKGKDDKDPSKGKEGPSTSKVEDARNQSGAEGGQISPKAKKGKVTFKAKEGQSTSKAKNARNQSEVEGGQSSSYDPSSSNAPFDRDLFTPNIVRDPHDCSDEDSDEEFERVRAECTVEKTKGYLDIAKEGQSTSQVEDARDQSGAEGPSTFFFEDARDQYKPKGGRRTNNVEDARDQHSAPGGPYPYFDPSASNVFLVRDLSGPYRKIRDEHDSSDDDSDGDLDEDEIDEDIARMNQYTRDQNEAEADRELEEFKRKFCSQLSNLTISYDQGRENRVNVTRNDTGEPITIFWHSLYMCTSHEHGRGKFYFTLVNRAAYMFNECPYCKLSNSRPIFCVRKTWIYLCRLFPQIHQHLHRIQSKTNILIL